METNPVCGMAIAARDAAGTAEYQGVTYHFRSEACRQRVAAAPADFLK